MRTSRAHRRIQTRVVGAAIIAVVLLVLPAGATAKPRIQPPDRNHVGKRTLTIRDGHPTARGKRILQTALVKARHGASRRAAIHAADYGGDYPTATGESVTILESDSYAPDDAANQSWADFVASLLHNWELSTVTVYFAPYDEVTALCSDEADACYFPDLQAIVMPGEEPPDGTPLEELVMHEYGHHVANNRENPPWDAFTWGPKRWASYEGVCPAVRAGLAFPGDEGLNYADNPGEAFAESYRVANGGSASWDLVDPSWYPDSTDFAKIRRDVLQPYTRGSTSTWTGKFGPGGGRWRYVMIDTPLDGTFVVKLHSHGTLDGDLYVYNAANDKLVAKRTTNARSETLRTTICGPAKVEVDVYRYGGFGSFSVDVTRP
jgi:hypothetical protein